MRNLIGLAVALSLLSIPGCSRVYGGPSVSVTISSGYSTYWDDDMDWDNVVMIDDSRIGIWVMLPSGRWVLRCRSMWWDSGYSEWCFGPWWYDYSISYGYHSPWPFYGVGFHTYMHRHHPRWHNHYFSHRGGHYIRRVDRHPFYRDNRAGHNAPVIRHEGPRTGDRTVRPAPQRDNAPVIQREPQRTSGQVVQPQKQTERTTVITRERTVTRTDGGDRIQRTNNAGPSRQAEVTRSRTITRDNSTRSGGSTTRTDTRSREIRRR